MKQLLILIIAMSCAISQAQVTTLTPGQAAPNISLKNVDNKMVSFADYPSAKGFIVVFTCNTCPVAKAYEERVEALNKKYAASGFPVIAVNANDASVSSAESFAKMQDRAKKNNISYPYLYDDGQKVTDAYGARNTPHVFVVSNSSKGRMVEYIGAIDNDQENANSSKTNYVEDAVNAVMKNEKPPVAMTKAIGCTVKRKNS